MDKIVGTLLVGLGLLAAAVETPDSNALERQGQDDRRGKTKNLGIRESGAVITSPPPFETLDNLSTPRIPPESTPDRNQAALVDRDFTSGDGRPSTLSQDERSPYGLSTTPRQFGRDLNGRRNEDLLGRRSSSDTLPRFNHFPNDNRANECWSDSSSPYQSPESRGKNRWITEFRPNCNLSAYDCPCSHYQCEFANSRLSATECNCWDW